MSKHTESAAKPLTRVDMVLLLHVFSANAKTVRIGLPPGTPYLYSGRSWKRVRALCAQGLLKLHDVVIFPASQDMVPVSITDEGIKAYNAALAKVQGGAK